MQNFGQVFLRLYRVPVMIYSNLLRIYAIGPIGESWCYFISIRHRRKTKSRLYRRIGSGASRDFAVPQLHTVC